MLCTLSSTYDSNLVRFHHAHFFRPAFQWNTMTKRFRHPSEEVGYKSVAPSGVLPCSAPPLFFQVRTYSCELYCSSTVYHPSTAPYVALSLAMRILPILSSLVSLMALTFATPNPLPGSSAYGYPLPIPDPPIPF